MILELSFSSFLIDLGGARLFLTSKSNSSRFFALDGQIFRSVRPLELISRFFTVRTSTCGGKARVTEIPEGGSAPPDPPGGKAWVTEIPEGVFAPPDPPTTTFQKICPPGKFFETIRTRRLRRRRSSTQRSTKKVFDQKVSNRNFFRLNVSGENFFDGNHFGRKFFWPRKSAVRTKLK